MGKCNVMITSFRIFLKSLYFLIVFVNIFQHTHRKYVLVQYLGTSKPCDSVTFCSYLFLYVKN